MRTEEDDRIGSWKGVYLEQVSRGGEGGFGTWPLAWQSDIVVRWASLKTDWLLVESEHHCQTTGWLFQTAPAVGESVGEFSNKTKHGVTRTSFPHLTLSLPSFSVQIKHKHCKTWTLFSNNMNTTIRKFGNKGSGYVHNHTRNSRLVHADRIANDLQKAARSKESQ